MARTRRRYDDDNFDEDGLLRDGHTTRISMMQDGGDGLTEVQRAVRDAKIAPLRIVDAAGGTAGLHRPGSRYLRHLPMQDADFAQIASDRIRAEARAAWIKDMQDAWRGNDASTSKPSDVSKVRDPRDAAPRIRDAATAQQIRDEAYAESVKELQDAWRR